MDILAHALYGATLCSRTGLAGGRQGANRPWHRDPSFWWAAVFGVLPDALSMWLPFLAHAASGAPGNFFHDFGGGWLTLYRAVHNLLAPLIVSALLYVFWRRLFVPSVAWTAHVALDAVSHGAGKFQTLLFYPFSGWGIVGIAWWRSAWFFAGYWSVLIALWLLLRLWRGAARVRRGRPGGDGA